MKRLKFVLLAITLLVVCSGCANAGAPKFAPEAVLPKINWLVDVPVSVRLSSAGLIQNLDGRARHGSLHRSEIKVFGVALAGATYTINETSSALDFENECYSIVAAITQFDYSGDLEAVECVIPEVDQIFDPMANQARGGVRIVDQRACFRMKLLRELTDEGLNKALERYKVTVTEENRTQALFQVLHDTWTKRPRY